MFPSFSVDFSVISSIMPARKSGEQTLRARVLHAARPRPRAHTLVCSLNRFIRVNNYTIQKLHGARPMRAPVALADHARSNARGRARMRVAALDSRASCTPALSPLGRAPSARPRILPFRPARIHAASRPPVLVPPLPVNCPLPSLLPCTTAAPLLPRVTSTRADVRAEAVVCLNRPSRSVADKRPIPVNPHTFNYAPSLTGRVYKTHRGGASRKGGKGLEREAGRWGIESKKLGKGRKTSSHLKRTSGASMASSTARRGGIGGSQKRTWRNK